MRQVLTDRLKRMDDTVVELDRERHWLGVGMALLSRRARLAELHNALLHRMWPVRFPCAC